MIWIRALVLAVAVSIAVLAFAQATSISAPAAAPPPAAAEAPVVEPTPRPTRVPLPTVGPQMIISRTAQQTPTPRPSPTPDGVPKVGIVDYGYYPAQLTVAPGTMIQWANSGSEGHDVTGQGPGGAWRSGPLAPGEQYERTFYLPGTYDYVCTVHPQMRGLLLVKT